MKSNYKQLGTYIWEVDNRNSDLSIDRLQGISSIYKCFMQSKANIIGVEFSMYKVVGKYQFAFNPNTARMGDKIPIALNLDEPCIVSSIYPVFEVMKTDELLPEYLMMWFRRPEFDRYARFHSHGSAREIFGWEEMCNVELPIPSIERQKEIVMEYYTVVNRIRLNEQFIQKLEEAVQAIYRQWFVDFEFPDENGRPYKSSGGEMVWEEEFSQDIPRDWLNKSLGQIARISAGGDKPKEFSANETDRLKIPIYSNSTLDEGIFGYTATAKVTEKSITISARGGIGFTMLRLTPFFPIVRLLIVMPNDNYLLNYLYESIRRFRYDDVASAQGQLTVPEFSLYKVIVPHRQVLLKFQALMDLLTKCIDIHKRQIKKMSMLKDILLSKMTKAFI
jgi:type I restriction enzyme, S subunit